MPNRFPFASILLAALLAVLLPSSASQAASEPYPVYVTAIYSPQFAYVKDLDNTTTSPPLDDNSLTESSFSDTTYGFGGALGLDLRSWLLPVRLEVEYLYRTKAEFNVEPGVEGVLFNANRLSYDLDTQTIMGIIYADIPTGTLVTPYIGGGAGLAFHDTHLRLEDTADFNVREDFDWSGENFAWCAAAGLSLRTTDYLVLDVSYRYYDLGEVIWGDPGTLEITSENVYSHGFAIGIRIQFLD